MRRWLGFTLSLSIWLILGVLTTSAADLPNLYEPQFHGQCTWWAAEMRADLRFNRGHAYTWASVSAARGYTVNNTPGVGAIAVWGRGVGGVSSESGHVAYVIAVTDNTHFRVSDYNWNYDESYLEHDVVWENGIQFIHSRNAPPPRPDPRASYTVSFNPPSATVGTRVQVNVGAADTAGNRAVNAIDVSANGNPIGMVNGNGGGVTWNTSGYSAGSYTIQFRARLADWSGTVSARDVQYVLQSPNVLADSGPDPWNVGWLPGDRNRTIAAMNAIITNPDTGGSPSAGLAGYGEAILNYALASVEGNPAGVNPAFALAMFHKEAKFATYGVAPGNKNPGNIICADGRPLYGAIRCNGRFGVYASMESGIRAYFWLLQAEYKPGGARSRNCPDIPCIIRAYAPSSENNTDLYIRQVSDLTRDFQNRIATGTVPPPQPPQPQPPQPQPQPPQPVRVEMPEPSSPSNGASMAESSEVTLSWNASTNATQYKVEVWGGPYSLMTPCDWQGSTSCRIGKMRPGTMSWHVKARNNTIESEWSDTWSFTIKETAQPPPSTIVEKPRLSSPSNGASMAQSTEVVLSWNGATNATQYKVELWDGQYNTMTPCNWQSGTSCKVGQMWPGTMSWHVKSQNASGQESDWSDTWSFVIQQITPTPTFTALPPSAGRPSLSSPSNGANISQSTEVTLSWNPSSNATQYKVELWGGPYSLMTPCNWQSGTSCRIGQMWPGTMSWHVKSRNASGQESDWSDTWNFTVQQITPTFTAVPPSAGRPSLSSPSNGANILQSTEVTLVWNASSNATQYKVELWGGPYSLMTPCNWQSATSCRIGQMWPGTMSWHVKSRNASGQESDWSDTWSFIIQQITPPQPPPAPPSSGNLASRAGRSPDGSGSGNAFDANLSTFWTSGLGHGFTLRLSLPETATVTRIIVWDRPQNSPDNNQINQLIITLSNGMNKRFDMQSGGPRCVDVSLASPQTINSITLQADDASGNNGLSEVEIWSGPKSGGPSCSNGRSMP